MSDQLAFSADQLAGQLQVPVVAARTVLLACFIEHGEQGCGAGARRPVR